MTQGTSPQDQRYAPPAAHVEDVEVTAEGEQVLATRWQRLWAALIDGGIALAAFWLLSVLTPWNPWEGAENRGMWDTDWVAMGVGFVLFAVIHGFLLLSRGQTVGKLALGIRIVRSDGSAASLGRLLGLRYGVGWALAIVPILGQIFGIVDALLIFRQSRRCLHDNIADTIVVKA